MSKKQKASTTKPVTTKPILPTRPHNPAPDFAPNQDALARAWTRGNESFTTTILSRSHLHGIPFRKASRRAAFAKGLYTAVSES